MVQSKAAARTANNGLPWEQSVTKLGRRPRDHEPGLVTGPMADYYAFTGESIQCMYR